MKMELTTDLMVTRVFIDTLCILAAFLPYVVLEILDPWPWVRRGFFCDDVTLSLPYTPSTVSDTVLMVVSIGAPVATILLTELARLCQLKKCEAGTYMLGKQEIRIEIPVLYVSLGLLIFGGGIVQSGTDICKYLMGSLRPHFLDVCQPNVTLSACSDPAGRPRYVTDYVCTGTNEDLLYEARKSFISGHASLSSYAMLFLAMYIQQRWSVSYSGLFKSLIQATVIGVGLFMGLSRIWDNQHHWWDVLAGMAYGVSVATWMIFRLHHFAKASLKYSTKIDVKISDGINNAV